MSSTDKSKENSMSPLADKANPNYFTEIPGLKYWSVKMNSIVKIGKN